MDRRFYKEIIGILLLKGLVILVIWAIWFAHPEADDLDAAQVSAQFFAKTSNKETK